MTKSKALSTNHCDPDKFNKTLESIMNDANMRLHKNIEQDGFVRPNYTAALMAEVIEDTHALYSS